MAWCIQGCEYYCLKMKNPKKWSKSWRASKQVRKQRKFRYNAPLHARHNLIGAHLSKELRSKYKRRALPVRKGDKVKILRGKFKGQVGKIDKVDVKKEKVYVENMAITKKDGTKVFVPIHPSNLLISELSLDDKMRQKTLKRK